MSAGCSSDAGPSRGGRRAPSPSLPAEECDHPDTAAGPFQDPRVSDADSSIRSAQYSGGSRSPASFRACRAPAASREEPFIGVEDVVSAVSWLRAAQPSPALAAAGGDRRLRLDLVVIKGVLGGDGIGTVGPHFTTAG